MGLTKQYLRYSADGIFGVVASKTCNAAFVPKRPYRFVVTGGANIVNVWDIKFQRKVIYCYFIISHMPSTISKEFTKINYFCS